jgi:hypothetical protein
MTFKYVKRLWQNSSQFAKDDTDSEDEKSETEDNLIQDPVE